MKSTLDHIKEAHDKSGAPGEVLGFYGSGHYLVRLQYGACRFRFFSLRNPDRVRVVPSWTITGDRQRKQATSTPQQMR